MKRYKYLLVSILIIVIGSRSAFADVAAPTIVESGSGLFLILILAVLIIIAAIALLRRCIKKRRQNAVNTSTGNEDAEGNAE